MSDGKVLHGQEFDREGGFVVPFTQQMRDDETAEQLQGTANMDINPVDAAAALVRIYESAEVDSVYLLFPGTSNFNLPDVLTTPTVLYNTAYGEGSDAKEVGQAVGVGSSGGATLNPVSRAQSSISITPEVQLEITRTWTQNVPSIHVVFFASGDVTPAIVVSRLETIFTKTVSSVVAGTVTTSAAHGLTVNQPFKFLTAVAASGITVGTTYYVKTVPSTTTLTFSATVGGAANAGSMTSGTLTPTFSTWPTFKPKEHTISLFGQQVQASQNAEALLQFRWSGDQTSFVRQPFGGSRSDGYSIDVGTTVRTLRIPPTIHGAITLTNTTSTQTAGISVRAATPSIVGSGDAPSFPPVISAPLPIILSATGSVTPTSLAATSGQTSIPTYGLYIKDIDGSPFRYGLTRIHVELIDFSQFA